MYRSLYKERKEQQKHGHSSDIITASRTAGFRLSPFHQDFVPEKCNSIMKDVAGALREVMPGVSYSVRTSSGSRITVMDILNDKTVIGSLYYTPKTFECSGLISFYIDLGDKYRSKRDEIEKALHRYHFK